MLCRSSLGGDDARGRVSISPRPLNALAKLAGCWILLTAVGAEAGVLRAPDPAAGPKASMPRLGQPLPEPIPGSGPRLLLASGKGVAPFLISAGFEASHPNPFTLVGNRTGLANATRLEILDGEAWLTTIPTSPQPTGLAAFQGQGSSVASR